MISITATSARQLLYWAAMIAGLLVFALMQAANPDPSVQGQQLEWQDHILRVTSSTFIAADWLMTIDAQRKGYPESNTLLGRHPAIGRVNVMIGAGLLANALLVPRIRAPIMRRTIWTAMTLVEFYALQKNSSAGLRLRFQF